ncbi:MAG: sulfatase-like hydrolase/transferase [Deltaproteobacteria bacterium]|nr:sulfatase-like hydrolase/transferase [Deltaproteobacteria bacterium]
MASSASQDLGQQHTRQVGQAVFTGALLVAIYDLGVAAWNPDASTEGICGLLWFTPLLVVAVPTSLALLAVGIAWLKSAVRSRFRARAWIAVLFDLVIASPILLLIPGLFSGPAIGASPWRWPAMLGAMIAVVASARLLRFSASRLSRAAAGKGPRRSLALAAAVFALIIGVAIPHWLTTSILPGLYDGFHQGLSLIAIGICAAAVHLIGQAVTQRPAGRRALVATVLAAIVAWPVGAILTSDQPIARQLLADHAPFSGAFTEQLFSVSRMAAFDSDEARPGAGSARGAGLAAARFADDSPDRDVLLITVDALRGDALEPGTSLGKRSPRIRAATRGALRYRRAYSPSNYTPYSIPGLMLGYVPEAGSSPSAAETIASAFARGGYRTVLHFTAHEYASLERTSIWPLASRGFFFERYHAAYRDAEAVLGDVKRALTSASGPMFIWAHLSDVHAPFLLRGKKDSRARSFPKTYAGQLEYLDGVLGPWLDDTLKEERELIWALSSDHGESLGERGRRFHGSSLFDEQVRVPLLIGGPGIEPGEIGTPVGNTALPATLLALAGATLPDSSRTLPLATERASPAEQVLIIGRRERCAVVEGAYKLIASPKQGIVALYDLERDLAEKTNLVTERVDLARRLLAALPGLGCPFDLGGLDATLD